MTKRKVTVRYERDEDGHWTAVAKLGPKDSAISDGPTLERARQRVRQAIALHLETAEDAFEIQDDVVLPAAAKRALRRYVGARTKAEALLDQSGAALKEAAEQLSDVGLSRRDAGDLLGLSGARVQQVLEGRR